ncbi:3'-5' exoribonuclease domain-containing protein, partial [Acidithiobacillus sp.]|uniref:3'-5' exoribonuclease domain-containing protein n=1 Tax=Acidithiobacillus sp. TaxID=1872118 RepID=UPI003D08A225
NRFLDFVLQRPNACLWTKGPLQDSAWLQDLFQRFQLEWPFSYRADRDLRTLEDLAQGGVDYEDPYLRELAEEQHNALSDARWQAFVAWQAFRALGKQSA